MSDTVTLLRGKKLGLTEVLPPQTSHAEVNAAKGRQAVGLLQRQAEVVQPSLSSLRAFLRGVSRGTFTQVCQCAYLPISLCKR